MRLFIAINFENKIKNKIKNIVDKFENHSVRGIFVGKEHLHLTIEFLGEIPEEKIKDIKDSMKQVKVGSFNLKLEKIGFFKRGEKKIYWLGVEKNSELLNLRFQIHNSLRKKGFKLEDRDFRPHITIGRKVIMERDFRAEGLLKEIENASIKVGKIDLMKSEHEGGELRHTAIYSQNIE